MNYGITFLILASHERHSYEQVRFITQIANVWFMNFENIGGHWDLWLIGFHLIFLKVAGILHDLAGMHGCFSSCWLWAGNPSRKNHKRFFWRAEKLFPVVRTDLFSHYLRWFRFRPVWRHTAAGKYRAFLSPLDSLYLRRSKYEESCRLPFPKCPAPRWSLVHLGWGRRQLSWNRNVK